MPKSRKPTETKTVSATKKAAGAAVAPEAGKTASRSSVTKKPSQPVAKKPDDAPAPAPGAKKTTAAHGPKATTQSRRDTHPGDGGRGDDADRSEFLAEQRAMLHEERASYTRQAEELKAQADSLALEHEPGDVQFDEEGGEGGTSNVDRELDLVLSGQARAAIAEIDRALGKIDIGTYGVCEQCGRDIPPARLQALPYAALCVGCKSGGLSRRS
jgi:DnaK suppressor protein